MKGKARTNFTFNIWIL